MNEKVSEIKMQMIDVGQLIREYTKKINDPNLSSTDRIQYRNKLADARNKMCVLQFELEELTPDREQRW